MKAPHPNKGFEPLYEELGYTFRDPALILQAFRHSSYVNEQMDAGLEDNERLEFLGDAVLDLAISHLLMEKNSGADEGDLSRFRSMVVDETGLHDVAGRLDLGSYLLLGRGGRPESRQAETIHSCGRHRSPYRGPLSGWRI